MFANMNSTLECWRPDLGDGPGGACDGCTAGPGREKIPGGYQECSA